MPVQVIIKLFFSLFGLSRYVAPLSLGWAFVTDAHVSHSSDKEMNMTPQNPEHLAFLFQVLTSSSLSSSTYIYRVIELLYSSSSGCTCWSRRWSWSTSWLRWCRTPTKGFRQDALAALALYKPCHFHQQSVLYLYLYLYLFMLLFMFLYLYLCPCKLRNFLFPATIWCRVEVWPGETH